MLFFSQFATSGESAPHRVYLSFLKTFHLVQQLRILTHEMKSCAKQFSVVIGILILAFLPKFVEAGPGTDELCERLYAEYLTKAQKALSEDKHEDALRFLLEAQAVAQKCADSAERPLPQKQLHESDHAFAGQPNELS